MAGVTDVDVENIKLVEKLRAESWAEVSNIKNWRRTYALHAMGAEITNQGLEGRDVEHIAAMAFEMADAMIARENKEKKS